MTIKTQELELLEVEETNTWINSNNSYEELKLQVNKLKEEYNNNDDFEEPFDYFLWIDNSNHKVLKKHGEIMKLIKSNRKLDREEAFGSAMSVDSKVSNTRKKSCNSVDKIMTWEKVA
jgi:hypothetical protein